MEEVAVKVNEKPTPSACIPYRYIFVVLGATGLAIIYGLKVNLSVGIMAMVNHTYLHETSSLVHDLEVTPDPNEPITDTCIGMYDEADEKEDDGPFKWNERIQGLILGSYFWGYMAGELPGGRLAEVISAKWVFFSAVFINVFLAIITPPAAKFSYIALLVVRLLQGLTGGFTFPAMHVLIARWVPPQESSKLSAAIYAGIALGTVISLPSAGLLADAFGWEAIFYVMGSVSFLWCIFWAIFVTDYPENHKFMSAEEKEYITSSVGELHSHPSVPWLKVFTSIPFYTILFSHFCGNVGWYMLLVELPTYMNKILLFGIKENALLSALPFLVMWLFSIVLSNRLDWARAKNYISTGTARKISTCIASILPAICLVGVALVGCDRKAAVAFMVLGVGFIGGMFSGFLTNHIDIAPNFAGTLMAITNTVATIPGFIVPYVVGELTHGNQTLSRWNMVFYATAALFIVEALVFAFFASGEVQPWNNVVKEKDDEKQSQEE